MQGGCPARPTALRTVGRSLAFFNVLLFLVPNYLQTWRKYDTDHSGFIETEELKVSG